ncbi:MAG: hypothetical protein HN576_12300 [Bacteriovoracaceae bacterium]|nr:hypothetical protein [Bacteriovoracaceae bacterium]
MLKLLNRLILTIILIGVGFAIFKYQETPTQIVPYPYILNFSEVDGYKEAENTNVLIVGDRMGKALNRFLPALITNLSKGLQKPLKIFNWSDEHEGLHRTLAKLKSLKKLPPIIIYHGASEEFYEKKFQVKKRNIILKNFKLYQNDKISSAIMTIPKLSKFIYSNPKHQYLPQIPRKDLTIYSSSKKQFRMELIYKIYEHEVNDLIRYTRSKDSNLIFLTTPINLEVEPKEVCKNSTSEDIEQLQDSLYKTYKQNKLKVIYSPAKTLALKTLGNAKSQFIYGLISLSLLKYKEAKLALIKAEAFDCMKWRGSTIFNNIMKSKAKRNNIDLVDFNEIVNINLGRDTIFQDDIYPQHIYYQQIMEILKLKITKAYQL